jgi:glutathione synthase/RimK-type ligase-like ATP-grasp enzyme
VLASLPDCRYVNHPHREDDAAYKPGQLAQAVDCGMRVPPTIITNVPEDARAFIEQQEHDGGRVLHKPLATPRWTTETGELRTVGVDPVTAADIDESVSGTAHLFQREVHKTADLRVTVIGKRIFTVRIISGLLDWRTDYDALTYQVTELDQTTETAIRHYMTQAGLVFGAFDFAEDHDGRPWFLECNPSGQFLWFEQPTGLPLAAAMADLLEGDA